MKGNSIRDIESNIYCFGKEHLLFDYFDRLGLEICYYIVRFGLTERPLVHWLAGIYPASFILAQKGIIRKQIMLIVISREMIGFVFLNLIMMIIYLRDIHCHSKIYKFKVEKGERNE